MDTTMGPPFDGQVTGEPRDTETVTRGSERGCALQAHTVQPSGMAALIKRSQQSGTESCAVYGNVRDEA
jgi:hypothetical protein